jgi:energy-coupling factor transport system permease protein
MTKSVQLDPRAKISGIGIVALMPLLHPTPGTIAVGGTGCLIAGALLGIPLLKLIVRTKRVFWFAVTIILLQAATVEGSVVLTTAGFFITQEGLVRGLELSACLVILLWGSTILMWSSPPERLVAAFETWLRPVSRWYGPLIMLLTVTMNLVPGLILRSRSIAFSFRSRGIDIDSGIVPRIRFYFSAAVPLFASSSRQASQLAVAMESRSYDPSTQRTSYVHLKFGVRDWIFLSVAIGISLVAFLMF